MTERSISLGDALRIHNAIHSRTRCQLIVDGEVVRIDAFAPRTKSHSTSQPLYQCTVKGVLFIEQNPSKKDSKYAQKANNGEQLTWISSGGRGTMGLITDGYLTKRHWFVRADDLHESSALPPQPITDAPMLAPPRPPPPHHVPSVLPPSYSSHGSNPVSLPPTPSRAPSLTKPPSYSDVSSATLSYPPLSSKAQPNVEDDPSTVPYLAPQSNSATPKKPHCKYGAGCFRKNPQHLAEFAHPHLRTPQEVAAIHDAAQIVSPMQIEHPLNSLRHDVEKDTQVPTAQISQNRAESCGVVVPSASVARVAVQELLARKKPRVAKPDNPEKKLEEDQLIGKWHIQYDDIHFKERLGMGAFGEVKAAEWLSSRVAVKILHKCDAKARAMFRKEAALLCKLHHPAIVRTFGIATAPRQKGEEGEEEEEEEEEDMCIVMEYCPSNLRAFITKAQRVSKSTQALTLSQMLQCSLDIASGLAYLHGMQPPIIHRDLKPANILMDADNRCKVADFGISRDTAGGASAMTTCGTPQYMSPEVVTAAVYTPAVDVYSFGMMMYEMLTGCVPFSSMGVNGANLSPMQVIMKSAIERVRPPLPASPSTPPELCALIELCWAHDPSSRPPISEVISRLEACRAKYLCPT